MSEIIKTTTSKQRQRIIGKLLKIWDKYPHARFCQVIANITFLKDIYYLSDKEFEEKINITMKAWL